MSIAFAIGTFGHAGKIFYHVISGFYRSRILAGRQKHEFHTPWHGW